MGRFTEWAQKKVAQDKQIKLAGGELIQAQKKEPAVFAGMFDYPEWEEGKVYNQYDLFTYNGVPGFVRQAHTSQSTWLPFSTGTEALYGARPSPDVYGVYPYVYNMRSEIGMVVRSVKDGQKYKAKQNADPLLYDPADVPALFDKI